MQTAQIVVGLGFGDEGKGKTVDFLSKRHDKSIIVRFSGGQQAGHTVFDKNNQKHIFSNYGSGTFQNHPTYFSEHTSIYLYTLYNENKILVNKGYNPKLYIHPLTKLTTPYDIIYNRLIEKINKHGSCGLGIASTMKRHYEANYKLFAIDLINKDLFYQKLENIKKYYLYTLENKGIYGYMFYEEIHEHENIFKEVIENWEKYFTIKNYDYLKNYFNIIFEGSQGILLDMDHGIFPNVTYANTTSKNAVEICNYLDIIPNIYYITRCYQTRHGNGWMSNEQQIPLINTEEEINIYNKWQGNFRIGEIDYNLINYSLEIDKIYHQKGIYYKTLVVNCLDQRPEFKFDYEKINNIKSMNVLESNTFTTNFSYKSF